MDKLDQIFDMIDHPEKYTEAEMAEILRDEESRSFYQSIVEADGALASADVEGTVDIDQEWATLNKKNMRYNLYRRIAAIVATVLVMGGVSYAAIHLTRESHQSSSNEPAPELIFADDTDSIEEQPLVVDTITSVDTLSFVMPQPVLPTEEVKKELPAHDSIMASDLTDVSKILEDFYAHVPQEKIYIQTDRPYYLAGDTIWYRAHVADALTQIPSTSPAYSKNRSRYVYVELYDNQQDKLLVRQKLLQDSLGAFSNAIILDEELTSGRYTMVAYTRWMENFGTENFAYQTLDVVGLSQEESASSKSISHKSARKARSASSVRLRMRQQGDQVFIAPYVTSPADLDSLSLVVYGGGASFVFNKLDGRTLLLNTDGLPSGRNSVALMKGRLVLDEKVLVVDHEPVDARIELGAGNKLSIYAKPGVYALSVCDGSVVKHDSLRPSIKSAMLGQGGVSLSEILTEKVALSHDFEREQFVRGQVSGLIRAPKHAQLELFRHYTAERWHFDLGENQRFKISGIEFLEGERLTVETTSKNGKTSFINVTLDEEQFPSLHMQSVASAPSVMTDSLAEALRKRSDLAVWKTIQLKEVNIKGSRLTPMNQFQVVPMYGLSQSDSILRNAVSMDQVIRQLGMFVRGYGGYRTCGMYRFGRFCTPSIYVNNFELEPYEMEEFFNLNPSFIKQIEFFPPEQNVGAKRVHESIFNTKSADQKGMIQVFVDNKAWVRASNNEKKRFAVIEPLGVAPAFDFPKSGGAVTNYWNPVVVVGPEGRAEITLPIMGRQTPSSVTLEGISHDGDIISVRR